VSLLANPAMMKLVLAVVLGMVALVVLGFALRLLRQSLVGGGGESGKSSGKNNDFDITLATSPALAQVRSCSGPRCAAWFLDTSRPGNRRWCSMETCGNKSKKSTWRAKHTTAPGA